jgi:DNA modification methylase
MKNKDLLQKNISLFDSDVKGEKNISDGMNKNLLDKILDKYFIKDMNDWKDVNADLIITDPPFGIEFTGKNGNYHRNVKNVVDGYVEWKVAEYGEKIQQLLECIKNNLKNNGQALIFSGWNNSNIIHDRIM